MKINRNNYEEFFLLYIDGELGADDRAEVEDFLSQNPDLAPELEELRRVILNTDEEIVFSNPESLLKSESPAAEKQDIETNILLYIDNELEEEKRADLEKLIATDAVYAKLFAQLEATKLTPENLEFPEKLTLYRKSGARVVYARWISLAAAAAILSFVAFMWLKSGENSDPKKHTEPSIVITEPNSNQTAEEQVKVDPEKIHIRESIAIAEQKEMPATVNPQKNEINQPKPTIHPADETEMALRPVSVNVQQQDLAAIAPVSGSTVVSIQTPSLLKPSLSGETVDEISKQALKTALSAGQAEPEDEIYIAGMPLSKTPLEGVVRKASRLLEKTANIGDPKNFIRRNENKEKN